jgi:two-component system, sensor histidine kinase PdtaS
MGRVTLEELMEQTMRSLSVAKPPGVRVQTEFHGGPAWLRTDRAVSLAMAMHELCFNGITHGLHDAGNLIIRARRFDGQLCVEVEDDKGAGQPPPAHIEANGPTHRSGIGLNVVRGLIARELRGEFSIRPGGGGAVAVVQFPLLPDEMREDAL